MDEELQQGRLLKATMIFKIRTALREKSAPSLETPSFAELRPRRSGAAVSFLSSVIGHLLATWILFSVVHQVTARQALIASYSQRTLDLSPAPIFWHPLIKKAGAPSSSRGARVEAPAGKPGLAPAANQPEAEAAETDEPAAHPQGSSFNCHRCQCESRSSRYSFSRTFLPT